MCVLLTCCVTTWAVDSKTPVAPASTEVPSPTPRAVDDPEGTDEAETEEEAEAPTSPEEPWDYSPYRILVWLVSTDPSISAPSLEMPLREYLDRDFAAVWRMNILEAPTAIRMPAIRDLAGLSYNSITSADPVLAVKRDHKEALRIRTMANVGEFVGKVHGTQGRIDEVKQRAASAGDEALAGVAQRLEVYDGDELGVSSLWSKPETEAVLVSRGLALTLQEPEAKLITPQITGLIGEAIELYDKIFIVNISGHPLATKIDVVELDTLMRHFGPVASVTSTIRSSLPIDVGRAITKAFAPVVRIDDAGQKNATGILRASGLILDKGSPAAIRPNDVLVPMLRKNDRNGTPILIGPLDWAYLRTIEPEMGVLRPAEGSGLNTGDRVQSIDGSHIENAQQVEQYLRRQTIDGLAIEITRGEKTETIKFEPGKSPTPLQPQYLGFTGRISRGTVVVASVIEGGPAEGQLEVGDTILDVEGMKVTELPEFSRLVVGAKPPVKLAIQRGESSREVSIVSTDTPSRDQRLIEMDFYAGRTGGLQGRKNDRTFRTALKVRPFRAETTLRLHLQREPDFPLIGYEIYQKELLSSKMTFIGRTDWNGRLPIVRNEEPLRLFYVKNGGAVLARLPVVPGLHEMAVADLSGDDLRLQAEAYVRGVQNAIVDLIAIRELFKQRIRMRLEKGGAEQIEKAEELMTGLRAQPSNEALAADLGKKQAVFLKLLGNGSGNQRRKVDEMFTTTRELLGKFISPKLVRDLEADLIAVKNGKPLPIRDKKSTDEAAAESESPNEPAAAIPAETAAATPPSQ